MKVGDSVVVKPGITYPEYGWGPVKIGDVGVITAVEHHTYNDEAVLMVDFPEMDDWMGSEKDLQVVTVKPAMTAAEQWEQALIDQIIWGDKPKTKKVNKVKPYYEPQEPDETAHQEII